MEIRLIDEYNECGHLIFCENLPGAFLRGRTRDEALSKLAGEAESYLLWLGRKIPLCGISHLIVQEKKSGLEICDADSDVIFDSERIALSSEEYEGLKLLALKSAADFQALYDSIPQKDEALWPPRNTFYGFVPRTARAMYLHTMNVNSYYFGEIGVTVKNGPDILCCRKEGFRLLEESSDFIVNPVVDGSYGEQWSLKKMLRRFLWHDRIHAKAMYRAGVGICGRSLVADPFFFG
ncbi:MAG: hypothetical protein ACOX8S_05810 [Christensenellales bacterium]|jgi:hypothetical protein